MRLGISAALILVATLLAHADPLKGKDIEPLLNDTTVYGLPLAADNWRQFFSKGGETIYVDAAGQKTFGSWQVRGDKYCSSWPPSDRWVCYEVEGGVTADGKPTATWISGGDGKRYEGLVASGKHIDETAPPQ
jgi:hypothetical protein